MNLSYLLPWLLVAFADAIATQAQNGLDGIAIGNEQQNRNQQNGDLKIGFGVKNVHIAAHLRERGYSVSFRKLEASAVARQDAGMCSITHHD
jgi:hypothetical protein